MSIIKFNYRYDFGHDWYVQVLNIKRWSLLQVSVSWNDYSGWPYFQLSLGSNGFLSVLFWVYKFGLTVDVLCRTWKWDYLKDTEDYYNENAD
jgi:hypothetical protein